MSESENNPDQSESCPNNKNNKTADDKDQCSTDNNKFDSGFEEDEWWPNIIAFFKQVSFDKNGKFDCLVCKANNKEKHVSASKTSNGNLRSHITVSKEIKLLKINVKRTP